MIHETIAPKIGTGLTAATPALSDHLKPTVLREQIMLAVASLSDEQAW